jgi:hypothetical protein
LDLFLAHFPDFKIPTFAQWQAKQQCPLGSKHFDSGIVDDLSQLSANPLFVPDVNDADNPNEDHHWSFSLIDGSNVQVTDESRESDGDDEVIEVCCGKRKEHEEDSEKVDYADTCAAQAAQKA